MSAQFYSVFYAAGFGLLLVGLYAILTQKNLIRIILALGLMEAGVNLLIVASGAGADAKAPILSSLTKAGDLGRFADPLPHALVLTSIVIGLAVTALALVLAIRNQEGHGSLDLATAGEGKQEVSE